MSKLHKTNIRIYYEDTDAGGVVYYANYLKFAERARTEFLRDMGVDQSELTQKTGLFFVVRHAELDIKKPVKLDDLLEIETHITKTSKASFYMLQEIKRDDEILVNIHVKIACVREVDGAFKPVGLKESGIWNLESGI